MKKVITYIALLFIATGGLFAYLPTSVYAEEPTGSISHSSNVVVSKSSSLFNETNSGGYVVISNESTNVYQKQYTGVFQVNDRQYSKNPNLDLEDYRLDAVKPFNFDKYKNKLLKKRRFAIAPSYQVGDKKTFWVTNFDTGLDYQIDAELMYSGKKANVWVHNNEITLSDAEKIGKEFDDNIYSTIVNYFGNESDVDGDGKIHILCFDIQDGFDGFGGYIAGYFYPGDLFDVYHSNHSELFYIDTYPAMGMGSKDVARAYETLAHEFQHMVNVNRNVIIEGDSDGMDVWLDEMLAMAAEQIYSGKVLTDRIDYYNYSPSIANGHSLLYWDEYGDTLANYSLSYLFGQYVKIQTGQGDRIFKEILADRFNDYRAVENAVKKYIRSDMTFGKFLTNFRIALLLKERSGLYGFNGDPNFNALQPKLFSDHSAYLRGGGAIVKQMDLSSGFKEPSDKGKDITYTFIINGKVTLPPEKPVVNEVSDRDVNVTGKAAKGLIVIVKKGNTLLGKATAGSDGTFKISVPKQRAGTVLTIFAENQNKLQSREVTITVKDKTPPAAPTVYTIANNSTTIRGKTEANATVYAKVGAKQIGSARANSKGSYSIRIAKQKAGTRISVYARDLAGNISTARTVKVVDKIPPGTPVVNKVTYKTKTITGKAERGAAVYLYKGSRQIGKGTAASNGKFKINIPSQRKGTVLKVFAKDKAGNKSRTRIIRVK